MIYPADDTLYNIEQKARRNEADDDVIFLLEEMEAQREMLSECYFAVCEYFDKAYRLDPLHYENKSNVPKVAKDALLWLVSQGYDPDFDWKD